jgi:hypothetical protein
LLILAETNRLNRKGNQSFWNGGFRGGPVVSIFWMAFLAFAAAGSDGYPAAKSAETSKTADAEPSQLPRQGYELRDAVRSALRRWARPSDAEASSAAKEFLRLFEELQAETHLARSQRESLRNQVRNRLVQLSDQISGRIARKKRLAKRDWPKSVADPEGKAAPLAQQWGGAGAAGGPGRAGANAGDGGRARGQGMVPDAGQDLVDLIQRVIAPRSWDINGGPGTIYYWQPGHALVIRQTGEVHDHIGELLEQMERMGR